MADTKTELRDFKIVNAAIFMGDPITRYEIGDVVSLSKEDAEHFMKCGVLEIDTTSLYEPVPEATNEHSNKTDVASNSVEAGKRPAADTERGKPTRRRS